MYKIKLPNFEGPFDLLLYFIKRDELDIYNIPISRIAEEFLNYVRMMQLFDLDLAGEFLVMAATLMQIKTQMLLPRNDNEDGEIEDPRTELVNKLIEYKQMKEAASELNLLADEQRYHFYRALFDEDRKLADENAGPKYKESNVFDLIAALEKAVKRSQVDVQPIVVKNYIVTVEERINWIIDNLKLKKRISFNDTVMHQPRPVIVVTFLALLELIKKNEIFVYQSELFDDIIIAEKPIFNLN